MDLNGVGYDFVKSSGFIKQGSDNNYLLLAGGSHKPVSDFVDLDSAQNIVGAKLFYTLGGNNYNYNSLWVVSDDGSDPAITFNKFGTVAGQFKYNEIGYHFLDPGAGYRPAVASSFIRAGYNDGWILLAGGGSRLTSDFALSTDLTDYVTINTPQTIIANKSLAPTAKLTFNGIDLNSTTSFNETTGDAGIVSGWVHRHYNNLWKVGHKRGGSDNSLGYAFQFSSDEGNTYDEKVLIQPDGNIVTANFGTADLWNAKVDQSQLDLYLTSRGYNNNALVAKTDYPNSVTYHAEDTSVSGFQSFFGTSLHIKGDTTWYNRLDFPVNAEKLFLYQGINTTDMTMRGYIPILNGNVINWDSTNLEDYHQYGLGDFMQQNQINIDIPRPTGFYSIFQNATTGTMPFNYASLLHQAYMGVNEFSQLAIQKGGEGMAFRTETTPWRKVYHEGNFNPLSKANAQENATGIGFSAGEYPTLDGGEYPYMYHGNSGSNTPFVALATQEFTNANYHKINHSGSLANQSDSNVNKTWFDYSWAGSGSPGSVINFSGLNSYYATELFGEYGNGGNRFGLRTRNGDANQWNDPRWIWHSGNFNPSQYVTQSSLNTQLANYATLNGVQTFANTNTFLQSPVIPDGTINSHAVNVGQLYYNDRNFITDSRGAVRPPSFYDDRFAQWDFQHGNDTQVAGDAWQGVLTVAKWSNFDPSHRQEQLLFTGDNLKRRTAIDDNTWGPEKTIWDSGNFTPANFATTSQLNDKVNKSGDTMTGALLIGNTNIGKQRVLHLAEPTLLDSYGFNFYTDTSTGLLTLHGLNNGLSNSAPILSANRGNNFVGINKENPASELDVNGYVTSNGFIKNNSSDDHFLMGGGGQLTKYSKDDSYVNSHRDFPDGTLITTNIDYSYSAGDSFLLEIKGNMYGGGLPMDTKVQGYIYADTIINQSGYSTYADLNTIVAMNINGNLCFWFPRLWYWQGFSVKVIATGGGDITTVNRVISIDNSPEPAGTKHVKIKVHTLSTQTWVNDQGFLTSANLNGYVTQSSLNNQLGNYATLNGVQTFNNTNTFNQSPVIPNGTLGTHAVNLNQLLDVAPPYYWNYVGQPAITNRRVLREMTWNNYGNNHTIFDISSGTTPWGASKSNVDAEQPWSPSYPTLVGGNGSGTYGLRVDSARNADNLGGISAGNYATQVWVNTNYIPRSHPVFNITQANINSWNAGTGGGSSHTHFNLSYLNNIDQYLGTGQAPQFGSIKLMDSLGYGLLALEEGLIGGEIGLVDTSNKRFYAGRINEYLKYGSSIDGFEGLNMHFDAQLLCIGREIGNDEDKVQLAGDLSVDTIDIYHNSRQLILNPLYNIDGDVRHSRNAHIYIVTKNYVSLPDKPILGQRIEIFNDSDSDIEVTHGNVGSMFKVPGFCKVTGIAANKGFRFDAEPIRTKQYDI
ncbi:hypothetical protein LPB90_09390 [Chryseobacterium sp. LC2016-29]|uniref:hypothetical protein n=1 Tax=Chryseobacterium sp. LC2016-29 TaxID=2897331 RepID=UPI001E645ABB|nr:hypothetical protein [Chryseobacterium sp. LC2016-29]MCD0478672.1 hypothetical protein [Chryseobacterium sp. LC2016-29]